MNSISPNLNIMFKACEKASKVIIRDFKEIENLQVLKKGPRDFVTKTDRRVETILIEELSKSRRKFSFIKVLEGMWGPYDGFISLNVTLKILLKFYGYNFLIASVCSCFFISLAS